MLEIKTPQAPKNAPTEQQPAAPENLTPAAAMPAAAEQAPVEKPTPSQDVPKAMSGKPEATLTSPINQRSVYVPEKDVVKNYPKTMSGDEIHYDIHTSVLGKTPEEYHEEVLPQSNLMKSFKIVASLNPISAGMKGAKEYAKFNEETLAPAMRLLAQRPDVALGMPIGELTPEQLAATYKPWLQFFREDTDIGKKSSKTVDESLANEPLWKSSVPWFLKEFIPTTTLELVSDPVAVLSTWAGGKAIQKFSPVVLNKIMSSLPEKARYDLQRNLFDLEKGLEPHFKKLGLNRNAKMSEVDQAVKDAAKASFDPTAGAGDNTLFKEASMARAEIKKSRSTWMGKLIDAAAPGKDAAIRSVTDIPARQNYAIRGFLGNQRGSALIPFSDGDLAKMGEQTVKIMKIAGDLVTVNAGGKVIQTSLKSLTPHESAKVTDLDLKQSKESLQKLFDSKIEKTDFTDGSAEDAALIRENIDQVLKEYNAASMKEYKTKTPVVSSGDLPKTMDLPFRDKFISEHSATRHAAASAVSKMVDDIRLNDPANAGKEVLVMAGTSGAGKTHSVKEVNVDLDSYALVKDTNVATVKSGDNIIKKALDSGHPVELLLVERDPLSAFINGVYRRFQKNPERRIVPTDIHIHNSEARGAFLKLEEKYRDNPKVSFSALANEMGQEVKAISLEDLRKLSYNPNEVKQKIAEFLDNELAQGKINEQEYKTFTGKEAPASISGQSGGGVRQKTGGETLPSGRIQPGQTRSAVNASNLSIGEQAKKSIVEATTKLGKKLENQTGEPLTHAEVIEKAKEAEVLTAGVSREKTLEFEASLLRTRQHLAALAEQEEVTPEFLDSLRIMANHGTDIARSLESLKINAVPEYAEAKIKILKDLIKMGKTSQEIMDAAKGVNFQDQAQVAAFYRKFVKPSLSDQLNEFAYMNILSSPKTHIVNSFSNLLQLVGLNPITKLASGSIDSVAAALTGKAREHYVAEVLPFYKGAVNALPDAFNKAAEVMGGKIFMARPDVKGLPTNAKWIDYATLGMGKYVTRALEASDVFFRTLVQQGEVQALSLELAGGNPTVEQLAAIEKEAARRANYYVFRQKPDASNEFGQGHVLSAIDRMTNAVYQMRDAIPGGRWVVRFVQTPMNIAKQGIEYSPLGFATMKGAKDKTEQAGKAAVGSLIFAAGSLLAGMGRTTWGLPIGESERQAFYDAGMQPYSLKIGNNWYSYSKIGPLAYPLAMAAAIHYYTTDSATATSDAVMDKVVKSLAGVMQFFGDQSYMQGVGDLMSTLRGDTAKMTRLVSNYPAQLMPLSSLQGWVNDLIDPIYRKPETGLSAEAIGQQLMKKTIGLSQFIPPQVDKFLTPQEKKPRLINSFSPVQVKESNPEGEEDFKMRRQIKQNVNKIKKENQQILKGA